MRSAKCLRFVLDQLYEQYNQRRFVHPDPLEFLYLYGAPRDREVVALIASSLAYGRVAQVLRSVRAILDALGPSPSHFLERTPPAEIFETLAGFKHRWTTARDVADLLAGARHIIDRHGSLGRCFAAGIRPDHETVLPALADFVDCLRVSDRRNSLLPDVAAAGACKRLHLMLRWLVRRDPVDPGGWDDVPPRLLIVPLDTHMHRVGTTLGFCSAGQTSRRAALAMTAAFRLIQPGDPVRYDFALTRLGIRSELDLPAFLARCKKLIASQRIPLQDL